MVQVITAGDGDMRFMSLRGRQKYRQLGLAYIAVIFLVAALSVGLAVVTEQQDTVIKREKELDWAFIGQQYQRAIASYYHQSPNGLKELPTSVEDLILDKRFLTPVRHLRKSYQDPITGMDWHLIKNEDSRIIGVYSDSNIEILSPFRLTQLDIEIGEAQKYTDVKFEFKLNNVQSTTGESVNQEELQNQEELEERQQNTATSNSLNSE